MIVRQVVVLLKETTPMSIIRLDIRKFYESISKKEILKKLLEDSLLSFKSKELLKAIFNKPSIEELAGLPRGLNISATMVEIFMRDFDSFVRQIAGVYYYARYVDDILIFCYTNPHEIAKSVDEALYKMKGLYLNQNKTQTIVRERCSCNKKCKCLTTKLLSFEYLGYKFLFSNIAGNAKDLKVSLAQSKIRKVKSRMVHSFLDHFKKNDFDLLKKRIALLSGNYPIKKGEIGSLNAGIYFNYPYLDDYNCLNELTFFLRNLIMANKGSFGIKVRSKLSKTERNELMKFNFYYGFKSRCISTYDSAELRKIRKCWNYV